MSNAQTRTLVVIGSGGMPERRPRLEKTIRLASDRGWRVEYWGWARTPTESCGAALKAVSKPHVLLRGGGYQGLRVRLRYFAFMAKVFLSVLRFRPTTVWALGLESALPVWLASKLLRVAYVFDDADRLVLLFRFPSLVMRAVAFLERRVSRDSLAHIIPGFGRYEYRSERMVVVPNVPDRSQLQQASLLPVSRPASGLTVYFNGWLAPNRGLNFIQDIAQSLRDNTDITFLVASKMSGDDLHRLTTLPNVIFLGTLDQITALAWYKAADIVITFYDPSVPINRFAEPNKWGDAAMMGSAILVNEEVVTALPLVKAGAAFTVPWNEATTASALLQRLANDRSLLEDAIDAVRQIGRSLPGFDESITPILDSLAAQHESQRHLSRTV